jgi:hypothetical protein
MRARCERDASELNREKNYFNDSRKNFGEISVPAAYLELQPKSRRRSFGRGSEAVDGGKEG